MYVVEIITFEYTFGDLSQLTSSSVIHTLHLFVVSVSHQLLSGRP
jgi:hypothetical protein